MSYFRWNPFFCCPCFGQYVRQQVCGCSCDNGNCCFTCATGPQGEQGVTGATGPQGERGAMGATGPQGNDGFVGEDGKTPVITVGTVTTVENEPANVSAIPTADGVMFNFALPQGERGATGATGPQGEQGVTGAMGPQGLQGVTGATGPQGEQGVTGAPGPQGDQGATGATGPQGELGEQGITGATGPQGEQGVTGPAPTITVSEDTPTSYVVSFETDSQTVTSPNLKSRLEVRNVNLSQTGSSTEIPIGNLILRIQNTSTTSVRISIRSANGSVLTDMRRVSIYDGAIDAQTFNNTTVTTNVVLDDLVYSNSQEMHWIRIRQQDPTTSLWSMCEVRTFISAGGARTSVCIEWLYTGATFATPT